MKDEVVPDLDRAARIGLAEAIFCAGKSPAQIDMILSDYDPGTAPLLLTRLDPERHAALSKGHRAALDYDPVSATAFYGTVPEPAGAPAIALAAAGSSDIPVVREAERTLRIAGHGARLFADIGVAGLWRLLDRVDELKTFPVLIVAAGMDAAMVSVLGGLVPGVVIAVPTSVGYGMARGGETALGASLASCAPGVVAVNIDNGYGAACAAIRVLNTRDKR